MAQDVDSILRQYESASDREPMHGRLGEVRRQPSTDEKRIRRELRRSQAELEEPTVAKTTTASIADLLGQASVATTAAEQQSLMMQVQALRAAAEDAAEADRAYDPALARIADRLVPGTVYERTTADSDWMLELNTTADLKAASNEMVVQASLWFGRTPDEVKAYPEEYAEQAANLGRRLAGQYGEQADAAEQVFVQEATRLRTIAVKAGLVKEAIDELLHDTVGEMKDGADTAGLAELSGQVGEQYRHAGLDSIQNTAMLEEIAKEASSGVPQVGEQGGLPSQEFSNLAGETHLPEGATDSNRAPALQELQGYDGFSGSSVVPPESGQAEAANAGDIGPQDAARPQPGFPVGASLKQLNSKESHMTQAHAACPTCGGQGRVATRQLDPRQAYSGLPQIDEIMNNSDTAPEQTEYPTDVAFPIQGGGWSPGTVPSAINQAEQQIAQRNQLKGASVQQAQANGRDNSGWMGDNGARGTDYPGNSTPNYGGPSNLGQPDPVYGEGGDNGNQPLKPYGAQEADDLTNNPQQWQYGQPTQGDQAWRQTAPDGGMTTQGQLSQAQKVAAVQAEIARSQAHLAAIYEGRA